MATKRKKRTKRKYQSGGKILSKEAIKKFIGKKITPTERKERQAASNIKLKKMEKSASKKVDKVLGITPKSRAKLRKFLGSKTSKK